MMENFTYIRNNKPTLESTGTTLGQIEVILDTNKFKELSRKNKTILFYYILTAYHLGLSVALDTNDTAIMCAVANRNNAYYLNTIGVFARTLTNRLKLKDTETLEELLKRVTTEFMILLEDQGYASYDTKTPFGISMSPSSSTNMFRLKNGIAELAELKSDKKIELFCIWGKEYENKITLNIECILEIYGKDFMMKVKDAMNEAFEMMSMHPNMTTAEFLKMFK